MKLIRIVAIKTHKSFHDFEWQKLCKNEAGKEALLGKHNIVFGENGSGKSSVSEILKSFSGNNEFVSLSAEAFLELEFEGSERNSKITCKYDGGNWNNGIDEGFFLFFDTEFINRNVHSNGLRAANKQGGGHTQNAGALVISLDEEANRLRDLVKDSEKELQDFREGNKEILNQKPTAEDAKLFEEYKDYDEQKVKDAIESIEEKLTALRKEQTDLNNLSKKTSDINNLREIEPVERLPLLPGKEEFEELFSREIKDNAQGQADEVIKNHFDAHRSFIESTMGQIPEDYMELLCPLCMQPLSKAKNVIEYYKSAFDKTYEEEKGRFLKDIADRQSALDELTEKIRTLPDTVRQKFDDLERTRNNLKIPEIYVLEEKNGQEANFKEFSADGTEQETPIERLKTALEGLKNIERKEISLSALYDGVASQISRANTLVEDFNEYLEEKNGLIDGFKKKYSAPEGIKQEIQEKDAEEEKLGKRVDFLKCGKVESIEKYRKVSAEAEGLSRKVRDHKNDLRKYLELEGPETIVKNMQSIIKLFNLDFSLEHKKVGKTKDYSFDFEVKDKQGNIRALQKGLSEGERQIIALAFFFALNEKLDHKDKTVLVFDDPISSLDAGNLKILADLIAEKSAEFSQAIILTHHPLFFKYLTKQTNSQKFGISKNSKILGGSFIYKDPGFEPYEDLKKYHGQIRADVESGNFNAEKAALKYGPLLRLAVERFVKHELLMWDKEGNFGEIVENLKEGKNKMKGLTDEDLETIVRIYKYCNYSNLSHADKEAASSLSELCHHIDKFIEIIEKTKRKKSRTA